jgi:predicted nucleic acid-binding protein
VLPAGVFLDTSVLLRFFLPHQDDEQAVARRLGDAIARRAVSAAFLDLGIYEFINVCARKRRRSEEEVAEDVRALFELGLVVVAVDASLAERTARVAAATGLSGYDAAFVAAARHLDLPLVTADASIKAAAEDGVLMLSDLSPD